MGYLDFGRFVVLLKGQQQPIATVTFPKGYLKLESFTETSEQLVAAAAGGTNQAIGHRCHLLAGLRPQAACHGQRHISHKGSAYAVPETHS